MNPPSTACVEKESWLEAASRTNTLAASRTNTLVPGRSRGVALKSKFPLMAEWAERLGFVQEYWSRLRVITAWVMRDHIIGRGSWGHKRQVRRKYDF